MQPLTKTDESLPWHPLVAVVFIILLYIAGQFVSGILIAIVPILLGYDIAKIEDLLTNSTTIQFVYVVITEALTIGGLYLFLRHFKRRFRDIGLLRPRLKDFGVGLLVYVPYFIIFAITLTLATVLIPGLDTDQKQELGFDNVQGWLPLALTFVSLVILPPFVEEILVRGFLFTSLRQRLNLLWATIITSLIFATAHLQFGSGAALLYVAAIDTFVLSVFLCWLREKTGSLWAGITLHAIKNFVAFSALFLTVQFSWLWEHITQIFQSIVQ